MEYAATLDGTFDPTDMGLDNVIDAIGLVQDAFGITGTTAAEALGTIEGSSRMTAAAWQNVVTAIAGGGDLDKAFDSLKTALFGDGNTDADGESTGFFGQIVPRFKAAFEGIADFVGKAAPIIAEKLPELLTELTPAIQELINSIGVIFTSIGSVLGPIFEGLEPVFEPLVQLIGQKALEVLGFIVDGIKGHVTEKIQAAWEAMIAPFKGIKDWAAGAWGDLKRGFSDAKMEIPEWFKSKFASAYDAIAGPNGTFAQIGGWAKDTWGKVKDGFGDAKESVSDWFKGKFSAAYNAIAGADGAFSKIGGWAKDTWGKITSGFGDAKESVGGWFKSKFTAAYNAIAGEDGAFSKIGEWASGAWGKITGAFGDAKEGVAGWFQTHFTNAYNAIAGEDGAFSKIGTWASNTWGAVKEVFGEKDGVTNWFKQKFDDAYDAIAGKDGAFSKIGTWATNTWDAIKDVFGEKDGVSSWFKEKFDDAYDAVAGKDGAFSQIGTWASGVWDKIKSPFEGDKSKGGIVKWFGDKFTDAYDAIAGLKGPFSTVGKWAGDVLSDILGPFEDPVKGIAKKLKDFGEDAFGNLKDVFSWDNVQKFFGHIFDNIKIPLPHFKWEGEWDLNPFDGSVSAPELTIKWYDKGGIFNSPSIIGVGEKRPEFVGALDDLRKIVREESGGSPNITMNIYGSEGQDIHQLAEIIEDELQGILQRREAGFA